MQAAVMRAVGEPLTTEDVAIGDPGPFEVEIEVTAAGLCHSDLHFLDGAYPIDLPAVLGHESAGVVTRVGTAVADIASGDHVIACLSVFCGACQACLGGHAQLCERRDSGRRPSGQPPRLSLDGQPVEQFLNLGGFAERMLVHHHAVVKVTERMPLDTAALLSCGVATGLGAVFNTAGVRPGESVAVVGCGGVGLAAVQGARIVGATTIVAVDLVDEKLELARSLGATHLLNAVGDDAVAGVMEMTDGVGVDHAIEAYGSAVTVESAFRMLRRGGTATVVGILPAGQVISLPADALYWERKIQGSVMGSNRFRIDTPRYVEMYLNGALDLDSMVTDRLRLDQINDGFAVMRTGRGARTLIVFD